MGAKKTRTQELMESFCEIALENLGQTVADYAPVGHGDSKFDALVSAFICAGVAVENHVNNRQNTGSTAVPS